MIVRDGVIVRFTGVGADSLLPDGEYNLSVLQPAGRTPEPSSNPVWDLEKARSKLFETPEPELALTKDDVDRIKELLLRIETGTRSSMAVQDKSTKRLIETLGMISTAHAEILTNFAQGIVNALEEQTKAIEKALKKQSRALMTPTPDTYEVENSGVLNCASDPETKEM